MRLSSLAVLALLAIAFTLPAFAQESVPAWVESECVNPPDVPLPHDLTGGRLRFCTAHIDEFGGVIPETATCNLIIAVNGEMVETIANQPPGKAFDIGVEAFWPRPVTVDCANSAGVGRLAFDATFPEAAWRAPSLLGK